MARLYYNKIKNAEMNAQTNKPWCLDDVPILWRDKVIEIIDKEGGVSV